MLTRIAHRGVQKVHGRPGQAQPIHAIWGLFEVRHHANSRVEAPRRIQGAWGQEGCRVPTAKSFKLLRLGAWPMETGDMKTLTWSHFGFQVLSKARSVGMGKRYRLRNCARAVNSAPQGLSIWTTASLKSKLFF